MNLHRRRKILLLCVVASTALFGYGRYNIALLDVSQQSERAHEFNRRHDKFDAYSLSHPLENSCRYPILQPEDENLKTYIAHGRRVKCEHVQADLVKWNGDTGVLQFDQELAEMLFSESVKCYYQTFAGGVGPARTNIVAQMPWRLLDDRVTIEQDMVRVKCHQGFSVQPVYRFAFSRVGPRKTTFAKNTKTKLSLDILVLDSTALNMFRRHAPLSWDYMMNRMGFFTFEGYTKVGDNSMVNLMPLLTGLRYKDTGPGIPSDVPMDQPLDSDTTPFLWHLFKAKNCATMFNDDIAHPLRGFMNYPLEETPGFKSKPAVHFYRPWHLYHRSQPIHNSTKFCFGNEPYYKQQLALTGQMVKRYTDRCHFSFNFLTDLTHDDPNMLEAIDEELANTLKQVYEGGYLNNTILVIMGDHGNRIELIRYSYLGRIEERMPFFSVYLPEWFRREHPDLERNLRINRNRLVTHFDAHEMFRDILEENFSGNKSNEKSGRPIRGISLFEPIPARRNCVEAGIPLNYCVCMARNRTLTKLGNDTLLRSLAEDLLTQWVVDKYSQHISNCRLSSVPVVITKLYSLTTNQYVQHGVRNISEVEEIVSMGTKWLVGDIEYIEAEFALSDFGLRGTVRFQHNKVLKKVVMNVEPYVYVDNAGGLIVSKC